MIAFLTPVAPEHVQSVERAAASVAAQTIPCAHLVEVDDQRRGAGAIRNRLLKQVTTQYVSFLDADDWLEPDYAERMLAGLSGGSYAYCDWYEDEAIKKAPLRAWCGGTWHTVTSVVPTAIARLVGGFDESLSALEDTDFYLKIVTQNMCGVRIPYPLMHYSRGGTRSHSARQTGLEEVIKQELHRRYGGIKMGCCGADMTIQLAPVGVKQPGDVLAQALWGGNRAQRGRATGREYPRTSYPKTAWVAPVDIVAAPNMWREATRALTPQPEEDYLYAGDGIEGLVGELAARGLLRRLPPPLPAAVPVEAHPDFERVKRLAARA